MADFGVFAKFARTRLCGHLWTRGLRQNVLRWLHFKRILIRRSRDLCRSVFGAAKFGALFNDFPLVTPLKNFRKWPILVSLLNLPELGFAGTFGPAVCVKMFSDDCTLRSLSNFTKKDSHNRHKRHFSAMCFFLKLTRVSRWRDWLGSY